MGGQGFFCDRIHAFIGGKDIAAAGCCRSFDAQYKQRLKCPAGEDNPLFSVQSFSAIRAKTFLVVRRFVRTDLLDKACGDDAGGDGD